MGCCPSTPSGARDRDNEEGWHKNEADNVINNGRDVAELQGALETGPNHDRDGAELPGVSSESEMKPELDRAPATPHHHTVFELGSPDTQRDGDTLPPPYTHSPGIENGIPTGISVRSPISPVTMIDDDESIENEKPVL
ncbi:unnamed protein product [Zymoseptoria tritici ST99CH_3D7]|uniref:Uncharacterized protein n=2 Tax=Zymoseptoria tritici TaxID=1047171 RepID=A0A1X7RFT8_ZYMT9|nr:unnamed protein product [Zymoseptoria tritici ST99CH_3D7]SMR42621.1 unnamed protein product [Zymoseptoria tritici ST99CH_1E4]